MSSIIVYGDSSDGKKIIDENTQPVPSNFYGDSKLQAEKEIEKLGCNEFKIMIIRPPMIYGREAKGNYSTMAKVAKITPIFPYYENERSMLFIDNLCELLKRLIDFRESGLFCPQNREYVNTSEMVKLISEINGRKIFMTRTFNPLIKMMNKNKIINKVFGNLVYEKSMSKYPKADYQIRSLKESIQITELGTKK